MDEEDTFGKRCLGFWKNHWRGVVTIIIPFVFLPVLFINFQSKMYRVLYLYSIMGAYWLTKVVPIYITALLPAMLLPIMGVLNSNEVCMLYFEDVVVLFFGSMLMGLALEYCNLSKRIAFKILSLVGNSPKRILWVLIFVTMMLSMWISNTSATALMCTVVRAIVDDLESQGVIKAYEEPEKNEKDEEPKASPIASCYYLSVAFAASIGGTGTLLGTSTNMAFKGMYDIRFPKSPDYIDFNNFIAYTWPMVILFTIFLCVWMQLLFLRNIDSKNVDKKLADDDKSAVRTNYNVLGPLSIHEIQVLVLFIILILLFLTMRMGFITGWADFLDAKPIRNSWPVIFVGLLLFTFPMSYTFCRYVGRKGPYTDKDVQSLLTWKFAAKNLPWGFIFLIGGGIALSQGIHKSGTSSALVGFFASYTQLLKLAWPLQCICIFITLLLTALTWNVLVADLVVPIVCEMAVGAGAHPLFLVFPTGLAASYAFLTPFSTPPNQLAMSYGNIRMKYMLLAGVGPTIAALILLSLNGNIWHLVLYPDSEKFPEWAYL